MRNILPLILVLLEYVTRVEGTQVLAKSKMLVCANDGNLESANTAADLRKSGSCKKKIVVSLAVESGQGASNSLHTVVDSVKDTDSGDDVKLEKPMRIMVTKSDTMIKYPMIYRGRVNDDPGEVIVKKRHPAPCCGKSIYDRCTDGWFDKRSGCPWWYHVPEEEHSRSAPYTRESEFKGKKLEKVWASNGFCCICSWGEKHNRDKYFTRGGRSCTWYIHTWVRHQAYAHCLEFSDLWDRVYEILPPVPVFRMKVTVDRVDTFTTIPGETFRLPVWKTVGYFLLSQDRLKGQTAEGRVMGEYVGDLQVSGRLQNLSNKYLLWPEWYLINSTRTSHDWVKAGHKEWLLLDKYLFDFRGESCNKIGVSFTAFKFAQFQKCRRKQESCLSQQPRYYLEAARAERKNRNKKSSMFLDFYGKFQGTELVGKYKEPGALEFKSQENYNSIVVLTIDAKDVKLVYNRSPGRLVEAYAQDFEALSKGGTLSAVVLNIGKVASDYTLTVSGCSPGINKAPAVKVTIDPGMTKTVQFELEQYYTKGSVSVCTVSLYDVKFQFMSSMQVNFTTFAPCYCPLTCNCTAGCSPDLMDCSNITNIAPPTKAFGMSWLTDAFSAIWKGLKGIFSGLFSGLGFLIAILIFLGVLKASVSACSEASKTSTALGAANNEDENEEITERRQVKGTGRKWIMTARRNRFISFAAGVFYFFYCPFQPCIKMGRHFYKLYKAKRKLARIERKRKKAKQCYDRDDSDDRETDDDYEDESTVDCNLTEPSQEKSKRNDLDYGLSDEYSSSEVDVSDEPEDVEELLDYRYPVFFNFHNVADDFSESKLENPGESFSLCGQIIPTDDDNDSQTFNLYKYEKQFLSVEDGKIIELGDPWSIPASSFTYEMDAEMTQKFITYTPIFPCLNRRLRQTKPKRNRLLNML